MANYAVRIELRGDPPVENYESLHAVMAQKGFAQTVAGVDNQGNNERFPLPHATYYGSSDLDCSGVRDSLSNLIKARIQREVIVFVIQAQTWSIGY